MRQPGVTEVPARDRRARAWVDFGVDESWEPARPRRRRHADLWVEDGDLFAPRYGDELDSDARAAAPGSDLELAAAGREDAVAWAESDGWDERPARASTRRPGTELVERSERPSRRRPASRTSDRAPRAFDRAPRASDRAPRASDRAARSASSSARRAPSRSARDAFAATGWDAGTVVETDAVAVSIDVPADFGHVSVVAAEEPAGSVVGGVPGRRTVTIRGRGAERDLAFPEPGRARRAPVRRHERPGFKPDRTALWALMLGLVLVLVAATSSHAATVSHAQVGHAAPRVAHVTAAPFTRRALTVTVAR